MTFHIFNSQDERRNYGGSAFIELQFCKLPPQTSAKEIVAVDNIRSWQNDSLYIDDENEFFERYNCIFTGGIYNNLASGVVDIYGINYYSPPLTRKIREALCAEGLTENGILISWLEKAEKYNGFYILGI